MVGLLLKSRRCMFYKILAVVLFLGVILNGHGFAQEGDIDAAVDYKVNKMQKYLKLSDAQVHDVRPIIKDYASKRHALLEELQTQGIVDHQAAKSSLKALRDIEHQQLSKILSEDQLKKWIDKENVMAALNPDGGESMVDDGPTLNPEGASFKF